MDRNNWQRKFTNLDLDLNRDPPEEQNITQQEGTYQVPIIIDDEVVESSAVASDENARRIRPRLADASENETKEDPPNQATTNGDVSANLEGSNSNLEGSNTSVDKNAGKSVEPPKDPVFNCPICYKPIVEETSTRCCHIFCKACIKTAVNAHPKCPMCRKKVAKNQLIRVFLPSIN